MLRPPAIFADNGAAVLTLQMIFCYDLLSEELMEMLKLQISLGAVDAEEGKIAQQA